MDPIARQLVARLRQDPRDEIAYESLKAHYFERGDFASLSNLLAGWAEQNEGLSGPASQAYVEAARAALQSGGEPDRTRALYESALRVNALHTEGAQELLSVLEQAGDAQALFEMLERYARGLEAVQAHPALVASVYARLGQLFEETYERPELAVPYYTRATELEHLALASPAQAQVAQAAPAAGHERPRDAGLSASSPAADLVVASYEEELAVANEPERRTELMSEIARVHLEERGDIEAAVLSLRRALSEAPGDVQVMHQLASCLLARAERATPEAAQADHFRVAELFYQIAQGVDDEQGRTYLESALSAMPSHDGALSLLERLAQRRGDTSFLPQYWVAFVASASDGPEVDARRLALGEAYLQAGQPQDAIECLTPLAQRGHDRAHELLQHAFALEGARPQAPPQPEAEERESLPTVRPRRSSRISEREGAASRVNELRRALHEQIAARKHDESAETCKQILEIDPNDPEAFNLLESHHRKRRDYASLRDLLLASTRSPGLSVDSRKVRLREAATLSESKLRDADGAISAYRGVVTLDPADREAARSLKRLLKKAEQWDELAAVLEREALTATDTQEKADLIHEIAVLHRDKRNDPAETAEALRQLHALRPADAAIRDELCELCLSLGHLDDAARLLREKVDDARDEREKLKSLAQLAALQHEKLADPIEAFRTCEAILAIKPNDKTSFDRMERIDEELGDGERLLKTLERRVAQSVRSEKPALLARMGIVAEEKLNDPHKASEYLSEALDLTPDNAEILERLVRVFERGARHADLAELLRERAIMEKSPAARAVLYRKLGETLARHVLDEEGAVDAYGKLLEIEQDEPALQYLRGVAARKGEHAKLAALLEKLSALTTDREIKRDLEHERAMLFRDDLERHREALAVWRSIVETLDPSFGPAIDALELLADELDDSDALGLALERKLERTTDPIEKAQRARRLAELCEAPSSTGTPSDRGRAISALKAWAEAAERDPEPRRRLHPLLREEKRYGELVDTLDALATWEDALDARDSARIEAASVAFEHLADVDSAWKRLMPLAEEQNAEAEALLASIAKKAQRSQPLAALYIRLAQESEDATLQGSYWGKAAAVFEEDLAQPEQALEAALRMLATNMSDREVLKVVDRLAVASKAFKRLAQVYDRLLREPLEDSEKATLLARQASAIEESEPDEALDRLLRACSLALDDAALLARTEALAQTRKRGEELLVVYDRQRAKAKDDTERVSAALRAVQQCDIGLRDRERAVGYLKQALAVASDQALRERVTLCARELDTARPELGADNARRALVRCHRELAEKAPQQVASDYLRRGAELLRTELRDERAALDLLREGVSLVPLDEALYDALLESAARLKRLDAVDAHLSRLIDEAIDSSVTVTLLRRRGRLLEGPLARTQDAAQVFGKLLQLRPDDDEATQKLRASLRAGQRFQDLLVALDKQLQRTREPALRLVLLKEIAVTWENDLKNRWEAADAWKAVLAQDASDADARAALERLGRRGSSPPPEMPSSEPGDEGGSAAEVDTQEQAPSRSDDDDDESAAPAVAEAADPAPADEPVAAVEVPAFPTAETAPQAAPTESTSADIEIEAKVETKAEVGPEPKTELSAEPAIEASPEPAAEEDTDSHDLAALDADLSVIGSGVQELDSWEPAAPIEIEEEPLAAPPPPPQGTSAPPLPPPAPRRASVPPPLPPAPRSSGAAAPPRRPSLPPPPLPPRRPR